MDENLRRFWAWDGDRLHFLGRHPDFDEADNAARKLPFATNWLFDEKSLKTLGIQILEAL